MGNGHEIYEKIAEAWRLGGSKSFLKILEISFTPEEAEVVLEVTNPKTLEDLAKNLNMDVKDVQERIDALAGFVRPVEGKYTTVPSLIGVMHRTLPGTPQEKMHEVWSDFWRSGEYPKWLQDTWVRMTADTGIAVHRILPSRRALAASPKINQEDILWYEDMPAMFRRAKVITVGNCGCRSVWGNCDHPWETCIGISYEDAGEMRMRRKQLTTDEAIAICEGCEDEGMLNIPPNSALGTLFCNCCPCCCEVAHPYIYYGEGITRTANLSPSRFRATVDPELCTGCQTCMERCHFGAIEMKKIPGSKKLKASVISEECMGCGLCVLKCEQKALTMEMVRPPEHIPTKRNPEAMRKRLATPNWLTAPI